MKYIFYFFSFSLLISLSFSSCKKDELLTDSSAKLDFSTDSVLFDTVFTTLGSTTKTFRIYNHHNQTMNISRIRLATGSDSPFKLNVDGVSGKSISDVEIAGGDSLFVFVQVTVDPNGASSPLLIRDSIVFETNENIQDVKLVAIGQDVYLHKPDHFPTNGFPPYSIIPCTGGVATWTNDKPHLIFGLAVVDSACTLTMLPGTRVHLYNGATFWVYKDGTLKVLGMKNNEVTFQGMRLESYYRDIPGQWGRIWLSAGSKNNVIDYAIIKNGGVGLWVDTVVTPGTPNLKLSNTIIKNMTAAALYGRGTHIWCNNCVFANCGQYVAALSIGGIYEFEHCTFANFWAGADARTTPLLILNNNYSTSTTTFVRPLDSCNFLNCILYGDIDEEIGLDSVALTPPPSYFHYHFDHCLLKTTRNISSDPGHYANCITNQDPVFVNYPVGNYQPDNSSPAINAGNTVVTVPYDLNGNPRLPQPDIGAYEH